MHARAVMLGLILGCGSRGEDPRPPAPSPTPASPAAPPTMNEPPRTSSPVGRALSDNVGKCVTVEGTAGNSKLGPELRIGDASVGVVLNAELETTWNALPAGTRARVQGTVRERADLPVFVPKDDEPIRAGIPVPEGTDLEQARKRLVIEADALEVVPATDAPPAEIAACDDGG